MTGSTISADAIDRINEATNELRVTDARYGAVGYRMAVDEATRLAKLRVSGTCPLGLRPALDTAVAWRASVVGFQAFDTNVPTDAEHWYRLGEEAARESGNWSLLARIMGQRARMYTYHGRPLDALPLLDEAIAKGPRAGLTDTEMAMLHSLRARALATADRKGDATEAANTANVFMFSRKTDGLNDALMRPWISHYDEAHHWGDIAAAHATLMRHGHRVAGEATGAYMAALDAGQGDGRSSVLWHLGFARAEVDGGQLDSGLDAASRVLDGVPEITSARVGDNLRLLARSLSEHRTHPEALALRGAIHDMV